MLPLCIYQSVTSHILGSSVTCFRVITCSSVHDLSSNSCCRSGYDARTGGADLAFAIVYNDVLPIRMDWAEQWKVSVMATTNASWYWCCCRRYLVFFFRERYQTAWPRLHCSLPSGDVQDHHRCRCLMPCVIRCPTMLLLQALSACSVYVAYVCNRACAYAFTFEHRGFVMTKNGWRQQQLKYDTGFSCLPPWQRAVASTTPAVRKASTAVLYINIWATNLAKGIHVCSRNSFM